MTAASIAACRCGRVVLGISAPPIVHAACYCKSCQEAGRRIGDLPGAQAVLTEDGGTDYLLYRKDRIRCVEGAEALREFRLKPDSPTRRVVAGCCNSAMFLDFSKAHWLTVYANRVARPVPPLQARVMTADKRADVVLPNDVPNNPGHAGRLMGKLLAAWLAMGFRIPAVQGVPTKTPPL